MEVLLPSAIEAEMVECIYRAATKAHGTRTPQIAEVVIAGCTVLLVPRPRVAD